MFHAANRSKRVISLMLVLVMLCTMAFSGCRSKNEDPGDTQETQTMSVTDPTEETAADQAAEFEGTPVTGLSNVYECDLVMGQGMTMQLYLYVDEAGNFVFSRSTDFSSTEKGAGRIYQRENGEYCMVYTVVNGEEVAVGDYVATFELTEDGGIQFTSAFWFGATSPTLTAEDGTESYVLFTVSGEEAVVNEEGEQTEEEAEEEVTGDVSSYKIGTYGGTYSTQAMGTTVKYAYTLTLNKNQTYSYGVSFYMMGNLYRQTESGSYTVSDGVLTLTSSDGTTMKGTVYSSGKGTLTRYVSTFAFSQVKLSLTYGYVPSVSGGSNSGSGSNTGSGSNGSNTGSGSQSGTTTGGSSGSNTTVPEADAVNLTGGAYSVDISWSPMGAMMSPVLDIDAEAMTFKVYNATAPDTSKGTGTISHADGVYTLTYDSGNTTTFTYTKGVITFTSKLWYGSASFDNTDANGKFVSYTATLISTGADQSTEENKPAEDEEPTEEEKPVEEDKATIESGAYAVDISWSPMVAMMSPVLEIDAEAMTFKVYNATAPETSKGAGPVAYADGIYTLTYENGNTTTFTYEEGVITFTSKLWYGSASFDNTDDTGSFVSYTATLMEDEEEAGSFLTGTYGGTYTNVSSSGKETDYVCTLTLNEDGSYVYTASFAMGGTTYTQTENGAYTVADGVLTLTSSSLVVADAEGNEALSNTIVTEMTGTIDGQGNATVTRYVSYFAAMSGSPVELTLTHGYTPSLEEEEEAPTYLTGTYGGTYETHAMGSAVTYAYTLTLNEDGSYVYSVKFAMGGTTYTQTENGTYTVADGVLTLTSSSLTVTDPDGNPVASSDTPEEMTGTIDGQGNATVTRYVSYFASMSGKQAVLTLTHGYIPVQENEETAEAA